MIAPSVWLSLKKETRQSIAAFLGMKKSGGVEVYDGRVLCDGYTADDLSYVTLELLQRETNQTGTNFYELFNELVRRVELPPVDLSKVEKKFCDECESKGVRHLKECPTLTSKE